MKILGISGSMQMVHEQSDGDKHDAAAAVVVDGEVVAAIEEERLNRIKHTDKFPVNAVRFVLQQSGLAWHDLDQVCYYGLPQYYFDGEQSVTLSEKIQAIMRESFGCEIDESKLYFVHHHLAHAVSTFYMSGFDRSLVLSIDGQGDGISGMVLDAEGRNLKVLEKYPVDDSLGIYYLKVIYVLGYRQFDEYKVMGLAPYGNPATYRDLFKTFYTLEPEGRYRINLNQLKKCYLLTPVRRSGEPFNRIHKDIAAALQESLEEIVMHILRHFKQNLRHNRLCLAGGVAHNCSMNGRILYSGFFDDVFVQPASHDAGCAVGAALYRYNELNPTVKQTRLDHVYWGTSIGGNDHVESELDRWGNLLHWERVEHVEQETARLMADGAVIGWVQGRSEFGPRALGNRSIVADPRPAENKDLINAMVKKREAYRPFAPSVLEEYADQYFDLPAVTKKFPFMIFVVKVRPEKQRLLGAITHVDGTARIQTVSRRTNPRYWELIDQFGRITGVPMVLNTSFNNNAEPIVDSVEDAIVCFYTTKLNYLVIGDFIIRKKKAEAEEYYNLLPRLPRHNIVSQTNKYISADRLTKTYEIKNNFDNGRSTAVTAGIFQILNEMNGRYNLGELMNRAGLKKEERLSVIEEIKSLWSQRFIGLCPVGRRN